MTGTTFAIAAFWSYGFAAAGCLALGLWMALGWRGSARGVALFCAIAFTLAWAVASAFFGRDGLLIYLFAASIADALRYAAWLGFVAVLLLAGKPDQPADRIPRGALVVAAALVLASIALTEGTGLAEWAGATSPRPEFLARLCLAIAGLVAVEQLVRRTQATARWGMRPLMVALGGIFGFDLFHFAHAALFGRIDGDIWIARGVANALVLPFIALATARNRGWTIDLHLSRGVVYQSSALLIAGLFLLVAAGAGYVVRFLGGDWGRALQAELLFAAFLVLAMVLTSGRFRSQLKVLVSKHFFSYRYDYREEWLKFTRTLSTESASVRPQERAIQAIADLVESTGGVLWLSDDREGFRPVARLNMQAIDGTVATDASLPRFLERTGWIITIPDVAESPSAYPELQLPACFSSAPEAWLIVPLLTGARLVGFVVLAPPRTPIDVDWEVRDVLKAAGSAAGAHLAQITATEGLIEARKFDAFNRMSAFVVHDLKNLIAQLSLMLSNAERHRDNPDFQRDMLDTVSHVVARMNALMLQLRAGATPIEHARPVELEPIARRVCVAKSPRQGAIELALRPGVVAIGHADRLEHVIGHLVQNAIDATAQGGMVRVATANEDAFAVVEVADTGHGMSPDFVRERLFRPFETTKPSGMGIGVYESQQYIASLGGRIDVDSREGTGTRVRVLLPKGEGTRAPASSLEEAA